MREILFKAKRIDNGEWVEGFYCKRKTGYYDNIGFHYEYKDCIIVEFSDGGIAFYDVDQTTICQYTGLTDKNGKKIWENDICDRNEPYKEIVKYKDGDWTLDYSYASNREYGFNYCNLGFYVRERQSVKVIGNIFDNPELLN